MIKNPAIRVAVNLLFVALSFILCLVNFAWYNVILLSLSCFFLGLSIPDLYSKD